MVDDRSPITTWSELLDLLQAESPRNKRIRLAKIDDDVWRRILLECDDQLDWLVLNKQMPDWVIRECARHRSSTIRFSIALKRALRRTPDVIRALAADLDSSIRRQIACNPVTPSSVVEQLALDQEAFVAEAARKRLRSLRGEAVE
ncbi:MAG: hypothetical protein IPM64_13760 [Phycisphaerales bacterium]|nr:hypothetical protein [Phycisphaerales bacterium]